MAIHFVPNDPRAAAFNLPLSKTPRRNRPATVAGFSIAKGPSAKKYPVTSPDFVHWQVREAALAAVEIFETLHGSKLKAWARAPTPRKLLLQPDAGVDVNAYYDGRSLSFFHETIGTATVYSGASADVVAHEAGHALLDALRPDLWDIPYLEVGAFHEAFGDCIAILTALAHRDIRKSLVGSSGLLGKSNFVETTAEELSWAIGRLAPGHNASKPRKALNKYQWVLPSTLPTDGAGGVLINEVHSFAQVFTGCFYDLLRLIYQNGTPRSEAGLWAATRTASRLLFAGTQAAPARPRFYMMIGQAMLQADSVQFAGQHAALITQAFKNHNIDLAAGVAFAPRSTLAGKLSRTRRGALSLSPRTVRDLRTRLHADPNARLERRPIFVGSKRLLEVRNYRPLDLTGVAKYLTGVLCYVAEPVVIGAAGGAVAALMSSLPDSSAAQEEARLFVEGLVHHEQIEHDGAPGKSAVAATRKQHEGSFTTHRVATRGGEKQLERKRFTCGS